MYYCNACEEHFSEPEYRTWDELHGELDTGYRHEEFSTPVCPVCGSRAIEEVNDCECGEPCMPSQEWCGFCHEEIELYLKWICEEMNLTREQVYELIWEHENGTS